MKEQNNRIVRKEKYNIAGLKVLMTTYYEETYKRAKKYIAKDENWDEKEADIVIDLGNETYEKIYDEYMPYLNCEAIEYIYTGSYFHHLLLKYNGLEAAEEFKKEVQAAFPNHEIVLNPLSLSIACHIGPGALAVTATKAIEVDA